jgi:hypothetical protein
MLNKRSKLANTFTLCFATIAFLLALYALFDVGSGITETGEGWFLSLLTLLIIVFSVMQYQARTHVTFVLNIVATIIAGLLAIFAGLYWILVCTVLCLIGMILLKASKIH